MIEFIVNETLKKFNDNQIIDDDNEDIYRYGLQLLVATIVKGIVILLIAFILKVVPETLLFLSVFASLRVNAGGVHADNYFTCLLVTIVFNFGSIYLAPLLTNGFILFAILYICGILIYIYAPVDTPNKPLNKDEIIIYTKRSRMVFIILLILITTAFFANPSLNKYCSIAILAILSETFSITPFATNLYKCVTKTNIKEVELNEK